MKKNIAVLVAVLITLSAASGLLATGCGSGKPVASSSQPSRVKAPIQKIQAGDIEVAFRTYGQGYPLVLIMGYSGTMDVWDPSFVAGLAKKYRVIMFDNRGVGETTAGTKQFTIPQFADDTAAFMDALNLQTAHVLGFSMGTYIAQELVLTQPQKVNSLILYAADCGGPQTVPPSPQVMQQLTDTSGTPAVRAMRLTALLFPTEWLAVPKNRDYVKATLGKATGPIPAESVNKQTQAMASWSGTYDRLPTIKSPTLLLTGTEDVLTPPQNSLIMANRIPGAWLIQYRNAGHGLEIQYPGQASSSILNFLAAP